MEVGREWRRERVGKCEHRFKCESREIKRGSICVGGGRGRGRVYVWEVYVWEEGGEEGGCMCGRREGKCSQSPLHEVL